MTRLRLLGLLGVLVVAALAVGSLVGVGGSFAAGDFTMSLAASGAGLAAVAAIAALVVAAGAAAAYRRSTPYW
ncbi:hypothetical protein G9C85_02900 [Halorubellus sp. JP-L1]|uniref:hypothetical protein n=1 Tax=Halorubellus sp. JP-L1 TaxID=2715753 RepID=UPI00140A7FBF|nr:hypothetical protein [Halorubellus sp. JP-L1]NHN40585.1 hypothetical protein [Halorubellus sp. JP-L1]